MAVAQPGSTGHPNLSKKRTLRFSRTMIDRQAVDVLLEGRSVIYVSHCSENQMTFRFEVLLIRPATVHRCLGADRA